VVKSPCHVCKGDGRIFGEDTIDVDIPGGVYEGIQLSLSGRGNAGARGGSPGDLLITVEEAPHENFTRDGNNIIYEMFLNFADAALGAKVDVPTLDGQVRMTIPPATQSGKIFRLKEKGMPVLQQRHEKGDMLVHVNVWTPKKLTDEEHKLLEKMRTMPNFQPNPGKDEKGFFEKLKTMFS
jgi:molecular chaperone DnaJ